MSLVRTTMQRVELGAVHRPEDESSWLVWSSRP